MKEIDQASYRILGLAGVDKNKNFLVPLVILFT